MMTKSVFASLLVLVLAGCGSWGNPVNSIKPHRIEIQQGNLVTQEQVAMLKPGMTPAQVRFMLGTPLIVDPFRANRWDYLYLLRKGGKEVERRHVTVLFENDRLARIEGDVVASKPAAPAQPANVPAQPAEAPAQPAGAPAQPVEAPAQPAEAPAQPAEAPAQPAEAPAQPAGAPAQPAEAPAQPAVPSQP